MRESYLEIKLNRKTLWWILAGAILLALIGLGVLGSFHTPEPAHVIWWTDWTEWKVERQYRQELEQMQEDLAELAGILQGRPDPVNRANSGVDCSMIDRSVPEERPSLIVRPPACNVSTANVCLNE